MGVSSRIRPPVFEAIWLGHPLANGLHMARLEDDADISGAGDRDAPRVTVRVQSLL